MVIDSSIDTSASFMSGAWWKEDIERNYCITKMENCVHTDDNGTEHLVRELVTNFLVFWYLYKTNLL